MAALVTAGVATDPDNTAHRAPAAAGARHDNVDEHNAVVSAGETVTLRRRDCDIACPVDRRYCYYAPYNYKCDGRGRFTWSQRNMNCEGPTSGCWCFCDWRPKSAGGGNMVGDSGVSKDLD
ncbi:hypothetical protein CGRA01v4_05827 [Colletotrichum graminicola]|uniref:Uncharacterized protein n=1 Tax=Colletotrichum graminicola (strain M1.001 / M2 / FGSC 10212) TaxID=645133 RepID=E3QNQ0_COLGM|nr:uncharacterized protein GLRG_07677 [Colletotrichum graminicola M1.001]EFQ32407.1 hypothetical protein GLRG_07677 [Colletotrichum graminicola M1.001]WDK14546.1 hypothetical protein CGRA01v4_05827 [Colletotrichum graminicola]